MVAKIDYKKCCWKNGKCAGCNCGTCKGCVEVCPVKAITRENLVKINKSKCISCGMCVSACKHGAITII